MRSLLLVLAFFSCGCSCGQLEEDKVLYDDQEVFCGEQTISQAKVRGIFNGTVDVNNHYSCVVFLKQDLTGKRFTNCSGVVVGENIILTAKHCFGENKDVEAYKGRLKGFLSKGKVFNHEWEDMAVVITEDDLGLSKAKLEKTTFRSKVGKGVIVGFGDDESGENGIKKEAIVEVSGWGGSLLYIEGIDFRMTHFHVVWWDSQGFGSRGCFGDSGGPLFFNGRVIGVFSFMTQSLPGKVECDKTNGGQYTTIYDTFDWIVVTAGDQGGVF